MSVESSAAIEKGVSQSNKQAFRNPWVLGWIALVVVVFLVNAGMVWTANDTFSGLVTREYYKNGSNYDQVIERRKRNAELGWSLSLNVPETLVLGAPATFSIVAVDAAGMPLKAGEATLFLYRASDVSADFQVSMEEVDPGRYAATVALPLKGKWDLVAAVKKGDDEIDVARWVRVKAL